MSGALIKRATIDEIDGHRRMALELYGRAFDTLAEAGRVAAMACPARFGGLPDGAKDALIGYRRDRDTFLKEMRQQLDRDIWNHLIQATDMERLMDHKAREQFRQQLLKEPPEASADNAYATILQLLGSSQEIFRRGVAEAFAGLDRRFKTHDGFSIGSKIILEHAFAQFGGWNYHSRKDEILRDIERAFHVLDNKPVPERGGGIVGAADMARREADRRGGMLCRQSFETETDYFRLRAFKNGNAHLFLKRDDLVRKVNRIIAEVNGVVLGDASEGRAESARRSKPRRPKHADNLGFFQTPAAVVERMLAEVTLGEDVRVLEPSAGLGAIAGRAAASSRVVTCIEIDHGRVMALRHAGIYEQVMEADFLDVAPQGDGFDVVLMNPPFADRADVEHVLHAERFLRPGGRLVAIMGAGVLGRTDARTRRLRSLIEQRGSAERLPEGAFRESGTSVATVMVVLNAEQVAA